MRVFLAGALGFAQMAAVVEETLARVSRECGLENAARDLEEVLATDHLARRHAAAAVRMIGEGR